MELFVIENVNLSLKKNVFHESLEILTLYECNVRKMNEVYKKTQGLFFFHFCRCNTRLIKGYLLPAFKHSKFKNEKLYIFLKKCMEYFSEYLKSPIK